jgi:hypothetical protein
MSQPNQQDIESWLWDSANILRGPVDPANHQGGRTGLLNWSFFRELDYSIDQLVNLLRNLTRNFKFLTKHLEALYV